MHDPAPVHAVAPLRISFVGGGTDFPHWFDEHGGAVLSTTIDVTKGCFLGQESVARVRNLGHPPTILRHVGADRELSPGMRVTVGAAAVGEVTSATAAPGTGCIAIVRVRWDAAAADLTVDGNVPLVRIRSMD